MTREEAKQVLENELKANCKTCMHPQEVGYCEHTCTYREAMETAISALSKEKQDLWIEKNSHTYICHNCGFEQAVYGNLDEYRYCPHCGKPKKGYECGWKERLFENNEYINDIPEDEEDEDGESDNVNNVV